MSSQAGHQHVVVDSVEELLQVEIHHDLPSGGYALLPAEMRHYALAKTEATVQVHGMGPFALTYVNPADDPSKRAPGK